MVIEVLINKQIKQLDKIGVIERYNDSEWWELYFQQPKPKSGRVIFISKFINIKNQLKLKPYKIPKIQKVTHMLEGFKYAKSLYLIMVYF